jgi:hypothetical protein
VAGLWPILLNQSVKEGLTVTRSQAPYRAKMATHMKATVGETFITVLISGALAFVAALAGFFWCSGPLLHSPERRDDSMGAYPVPSDRACVRCHCIFDRSPKDRRTG